MVSQPNGVTRDAPRADSIPSSSLASQADPVPASASYSVSDQGLPGGHVAVDAVLAGDRFAARVEELLKDPAGPVEGPDDDTALFEAAEAAYEDFQRSREAASMAYQEPALSASSMPPTLGDASLRGPDDRLLVEDSPQLFEFVAEGADQVIINAEFEDSNAISLLGDAAKLDVEAPDGTFGAVVGAIAIDTETPLTSFPSAAEAEAVAASLLQGYSDGDAEDWSQLLALMEEALRPEASMCGAQVPLIKSAAAEEGGPSLSQGSSGVPAAASEDNVGSLDAVTRAAVCSKVLALLCTAFPIDAVSGSSPAEGPSPFPAEALAPLLPPLIHLQSHVPWAAGIVRTDPVLKRIDVEHLVLQVLVLTPSTLLPPSPDPCGICGPAGGHELGLRQNPFGTQRQHFRSSRRQCR